MGRKESNHCINQSPVQRGQNLKCQLVRKLENVQMFACGTNKILLEIMVPDKQIF